MLTFILVFLVLYIWHGLGVTVGYHRLLSHRSFSCRKPLEYFFVLGGYLAFEGSPIWWAAMHRAHHRYVDTPLDPHSPRVGGIKNAFIGWTMHDTYPEHIDPNTQCKDLMKDPLYRFLDQDGDWTKAHIINFGFGLVVRLALFFIFGWQVALASLLAGVAVLQIPLLLNVVCHLPKWGYKNYAVTDDSVNVWWVAVLALGEGWHNNHHAFPGSARSGLKWYEFDFSWLTLRFMKLLGWVGYMNEAVVASFEAKKKAGLIPQLTMPTLPALPEMPKLPNLQFPDMPQLPQLSDIHLPEMPQLPNLADFHLPELPQMPNLANMQLPQLPEIPQLAHLSEQLSEHLTELSNMQLPEMPELPELPGLKQRQLAYDTSHIRRDE